MVRSTIRSTQCSAHTKQGDQCRRWSVAGATVCIVHGGAAPQVRRKAEERIRELVNPALARIARLIGDDAEPGAESEAVSLAAARDILDRAGYGATHKLDARIEGDVQIREVSELDRRIDALLGRMAQLDDSGESPPGVAARGEAEPADPAG